MKISRWMPCVMVAAMLASPAVPAPAHAQLGGLVKKVKAKINQQVGNTDSTATGAANPAMPGAAKKPGRTPAAAPGPRFDEYTLEITPALLNQLEKGLAAEQVVRQDIDRKIGKVLSHDEYEKCELAVLKTPQGQQVYQSFVVSNDTSYANIKKQSEDLARRIEQIVEPKCGLQERKAEQIRRQYADSLEAAAPAASGLTRLQITLAKERILPLCAAAQAVVAAAGEMRVSAGTSYGNNPIYFVYTPNEVSAVQPRCATLASALSASL